MLGYGSDFNFSTELGVYWERPHPGPFQWNIVEETSGVYNFTWADWYVNQTQNLGINMLATIFPYAVWDQNVCHGSDNSCNGSGFEPQGKTSGRGEGGPEPPFNTIPIKRCKPCNMTAYRNFVVAMVERYDGDGVSDMPGLCVPILYYETLNEPSMNESLSFFRGNVTDYVDILNVTYGAVKEACPGCQVLYGGVAGDFDEALSHFNQTIARGAANFFDIANIHAISAGEYVSLGFKDNLDALGVNKTIWMTEVSFYSLSPEGRPYVSLEEQAGIFTKGYARGMSDGQYRKLFYTSRTGTSNNDTLDTEALVDANGTKKPIYYAHRVFINKLNYFDSVQTLGGGWCRFNVSGNLVYVLWNHSGSLIPAEITGTVLVTYLNGTNVTKDASEVTLTGEPLIVESVSQGGINVTGDCIPESGVRMENGTVPYIYYIGNTTYRLYYCGALGGMWSALSTDSGLNFTGAQSTGLDGCDPSVIRLSNGSYRMYYKVQDPGNNSIHRIYSAMSNNGFNFTSEGLRFEYMNAPDNGFTSVPDAVQYPNGSVRLYYCNGLNIASAFSSNGVNFTRDDGIRLQYALDPSVIQLPNGTYRMYYVTSVNETPSGSILMTDTIRSAVSINGLNWTKESGVRIARSNNAYDFNGVLDPSAVVLPDNRTRVYYGAMDENNTYGRILSMLSNDSTTSTTSTTTSTTTTTILSGNMTQSNIPLKTGWNLVSIPLTPGEEDGGEPPQSPCNPLMSGDDRPVIQQFFTNHSDSVNKSELIAFLSNLEAQALAGAIGPAAQKVYYSLSSNGLNLSSETPIINSTSVPDAIRFPDGTIRIYGISGDSYRVMKLLVEDLTEPINYNAFDDAMCPVGVPAELAVFRSSNGINFTQEILKITNLSFDFGYADPSAMILPNGTVRIFFMGANKSLNWSSADPASAPLHHIFSAVSNNGVNFTLEPGFRMTGSQYTDPDIIKIGEQYKLHWNGGRLATSTDGMNFTEQAGGLGFYVFCVDVATWPTGGYRMYFNGNETYVSNGQNVTPSDLITSFSTDGANWTRDPGMRMGGSGCGSLITINSSSYILYTLH